MIVLGQLRIEIGTNVRRARRLSTGLATLAMAGAMGLPHTGCKPPAVAEQPHGRYELYVPLLPPPGLAWPDALAECYEAEATFVTTGFEKSVDEKAAEATEAGYIQHNVRVLRELADKKLGQCTPAPFEIGQWPDLRRHFDRVLEPLGAHAAGNVMGLDYTISIMRDDADPKRISHAVCGMLHERKVPVAKVAFNAPCESYRHVTFRCEGGGVHAMDSPLPWLTETTQKQAHAPGKTRDRGDPAREGAAYFRRLLDEQGARGIMCRLYVAPPDLFGPLFEGISTGTAVWIDVYDRFRRDLDSLERNGVTKSRLDDALARALGQAPESVLTYLREHPNVLVNEICRRSPWETDDEARVLPPRELLAIVQRQRKISAVSRSDVLKERAACLKATSDLLNRQLRIYLASYGAEDAKADAATKLSDAEKRELDPVVAAARRDPALRARRDGTFPDGPFRLAAVPRNVIELCAQGNAIANPEGPWEPTDDIKDERLPRVRLLNACQMGAREWDITCELGGFALHIRHVRTRQSDDGWKIVRDADSRSTASKDGARFDPWVECRSLSAAQP